MKTNKEFTLIEPFLALVILSLLIAIMVPAIQRVKENQKKRENIPIQVEQETNLVTIFKVGDIVVINGINKTGVVNYVFYGQFGKNSITIVTSDGMKIDLDPRILHKVNQ
jgi:competence protein ComGC